MARTLDSLFERVTRGDYYEYERTMVSIGGATYTVVDRMGLAGRPDEDYAAQLLAANVALQPDAQVANIGCGHGLVAVAASRQAANGQVYAVDSDYVAVEAARCSVQLNGAHNVHVLLGDGTTAIRDRNYDAVLIRLPKGRELVHQMILDAHDLLNVDGELYLAGANRAGMKSASRFVEQVFGHVQVLAYRKGHRVVRATKATSALSAEVKAAVDPRYYVESELCVQARGKGYTVLTKPGIFGWDRLDPGTAALLESMRIQAGDTVLDLGCGYGIIGLVAAELAPQGFVYAVDANCTAVEMTRRTFQHNRVGNAQALAGDVVSAVRHLQFDTVVTNPPFHSGVEADFATPLAFIAGSAQVLKPGGRLYLVANRFIKYEPYIERVFSRIHAVYQDNRFKVLEGIR